MPSRFTWYDNRVRDFTVVWPQQAHLLASAEAAGVGAVLIKSSYSGQLARDVSRPKPIGFLRTLVGSDRVYAAMENWGGTIYARRGPYLYIHGRRGGAGGRGTRSHFGGPIVARVPSVPHVGKHYLEAVVEAFPVRFGAALRSKMPGA